MAMIRVEAWDLHYKDPGAGQKGSDKYYRVYLSEQGHLLLHWGRVYTAGQMKTERMERQAASALATKQVYSKLGKGYKELRHAFFMIDHMDMLDLRKIETRWREHEKNESLISNGHSSEIVQVALEAENLLLAMQTRDPSDLADLLDEVVKLKDRYDVLKEQMSKADAAITILGLISQARLAGATP